MGSYREWKSDSARLQDQQYVPHSPELIKAVRNQICSCWKCVSEPLPPHHPKFSDRDVVMDPFAIRGPPPPDIARSRWWTNDFFIIDLELLLRQKVSEHKTQKVAVFTVVVLMKWMRSWIPVRCVLKCWYHNARTAPSLWPRVPAHMVDILGHHIFTDSLFLAHSHFVAPNNQRYTVMLTVRAVENVFQFMSRHLQDDLFFAQTKSFLGQILFYSLPLFRHKHMLQHNDLKLDNVVYTTESETTVLRIRFTFQDETKPPLDLSVPTYGKRVHLVDFEHASFTLRHPDFVLLSSHSNSRPLLGAKRPSVRDVLMMLLTIPRVSRWPDPSLSPLLAQVTRHVDADPPQSLQLYCTDVDVAMERSVLHFLCSFAEEFRVLDAAFVPDDTYCWDSVWCTSDNID